MGALQSHDQQQTKHGKNDNEPPKKLRLLRSGRIFKYLFKILLEMKKAPPGF